MTNMADDIKSPRVYLLLNKRIRELGFESRADFIRKFNNDHGMKAEGINHMYKVLAGKSIVGERLLLPMLAQSLDLDIEELTELVRLDKFNSKYGMSSMPKASKVVQELAIVMDSLDKRDQEEVLRFAQMKANQL